MVYKWIAFPSQLQIIVCIDYFKPYLVVWHAEADEKLYAEWRKMESLRQRERLRNFMQLLVP